MKRLIKRVSQALWRASGSIRRPLMARFDAHVSGLIAGTVNSRMMPPLMEGLAISCHRLERIETTLARADQSATALAEEIDLVFNGLSREVYRLQAQVEMLQKSLLEERQSVAGGLSIVEESVEDSPLRRSNPSERSRVG